MKNVMRGNIFIAFVITGLIFQSCGGSRLITSPKQDMVLKYQSKGGNNGAQVAYNPKKQLYYAAFGGNAEFPLETFDKEGRSLYRTNAGADLRGLWWNSRRNKLEGNCYNDGGYIVYDLTSDGYATNSSRTILSGQHQPNEHSGGVFDFEANELLFYDGGSVHRYGKLNGDYLGSYELKNSPTSFNNVNAYAMIFTGKKGKEFGLLDYVNKKVHFFSKKTGEYTASATLPANAPAHDILRFSFANDHVWLYDKDTRSWYGYKVF